MEPSSRPKKEFQKKYIRVRVDFRDDGSMLPRSILWEDGREFLVDQVLDIWKYSMIIEADGEEDTSAAIEKRLAEKNLEYLLVHKENGVMETPGNKGKKLEDYIKDPERVSEIKKRISAKQ